MRCIVSLCLLFYFFSIVSCWSQAVYGDADTITEQPNPHLWNGKRAAVVLSYDDGLSVHLDNVLPELDRLGLKATFYVYVASEEFNSRIDDWKALSIKGHEIGNHSVYHPCPSYFSGSVEDGNFLPDIGKYTVSQMLEEIRLANEVLQKLDGQSQRTYAYPCGNKRIGDSLYIYNLPEDIIAARGISARTIDFSNHEIYDLGAFMIGKGTSLDALIRLVDRTIQRGRLIIFVFHGIGGGHEINMNLEEHIQFLEYLKSREADVWITTLREAISPLPKN